MTDFTGTFWQSRDTGFADATTPRIFNHLRPTARSGAALRSHR